MKTTQIRIIASFVAAWFGIVAISAITPSCAISVDPLTGERGAFGYSWSEEIQLGRQADQQIAQEYGIYDDSGLSSYVDRVGQAVLAKSHVRGPDADAQFKNTPFYFKVLDSPVTNAFALPGGYVYVTRGILAHMENEAQLAVVLGHEIGHVIARHSSRRALKGRLAQIGLQGGAILAQSTLGYGGEEIMSLGSQAAQFLFLKYSRDDERQADRLGVEYSAKAGYNAAEARGFFEMLERMSEGHGSLPTFMSTHPDPGNRKQSMVTMSRDWESKGFQQPRVERDGYLSSITGLVVGEDPRQGYTEGGVFYHPELRLMFPVPDGWRAINNPTMVGMVQPNQEAQIIFQIAQGAANAEAAGRAFASQEGLTVRQNGRTQVNGAPAWNVVGSAVQEGQQLTVRSLFIDYNGRVYSFMGIAPSPKYASHASAISRTMEGFMPLRDSNKINVEPLHLAVQQARHPAPFRSLLPSPLPRGFSAEDLALMNQVSISELLPEGSQIKLPR